MRARRKRANENSRKVSASRPGSFHRAPTGTPAPANSAPANEKGSDFRASVKDFSCCLTFKLLEIIHEPVRELANEIHAALRDELDAAR